jgi:hypothetical protein
MVKMRRNIVTAGMTLIFIARGVRSSIGEGVSDFRCAPFAKRVFRFSRGSVVSRLNRGSCDLCRPLALSACGCDDIVGLCMKRFRCRGPNVLAAFTHSGRRTCAMFILCFLGLGASISAQPVQLVPSHAVTINSDAARMETTYRATEGSCSVSWTVYHSKVNEGVIRHNSNCPWPFGAQAELISAILGSALKDADVARTFHTLFVGAIQSSSEMSVRLAILASRSPDWNTSNGQVKSGTINRFITRLANDGQLYREWDNLFRSFGRTVRVSGVENVSVSRAGDLPKFTELARQGLKRNSWVPHNALVWLAVSAPGDR